MAYWLVQVHTTGSKLVYGMRSIVSVCLVHTNIVLGWYLYGFQYWDGKPCQESFSLKYKKKMSVNAPFLLDYGVCIQGKLQGFPGMPRHMMPYMHVHWPLGGSGISQQLIKLNCLFCYQKNLIFCLPPDALALSFQDICILVCRWFGIWKLLMNGGVHWVKYSTT